MAAFLGKISGGEVHDDPFRRECEPKGGKSGPDTFTALANRLVRQADNMKRWLAAGHLDLHIHGLGVYALKCKRRNPANHLQPLSAWGKWLTEYCEQIKNEIPKS